MQHVHGISGGGLHLTLELFKLKAGLDLNHIPYKGGGPAVADTIAGQIQATFIGMRRLIAIRANRPHARAGRHVGETQRRIAGTCPRSANSVTTSW